jgi:hypothetical protein
MESSDYTICKTFEEEELLREIIEQLRADNGMLMRGLLKNLGPGLHQRRLAEILVHHPNLKDTLGCPRI